MPKMLIGGRFARALSALGGRNLLKTGELLAGNLAELLPDSDITSDGTKIVLSKGNQTLTFTPKQGKPVFRGKYYVYQKGSILVEGDMKSLEEIKTLLLKLASERKDYLLSRYSTEQLEGYGIETEFVLELEKRVSQLEVS